jgi:uncharacterized protein (DUF302 family)
VTTGPISDTSYQAHRLTVTVNAPFDDFRRRYEQAVPAYDASGFAELIARKADWSAVLDLMNRSAPHGFLIYWSIDAQPIMSLAGSRARCVEYLMGNTTIAERMFRHDPTVMMYAPLHTAITADSDGVTSFSIDQPSSAFASFGSPEIAAVGVELDHKVAALLGHLDAAVPPSLVAHRPPAR